MSVRPDGHRGDRLAVGELEREPRQVLGTAQMPEAALPARLHPRSRTGRGARARTVREVRHRARGLERLGRRLDRHQRLDRPQRGEAIDAEPREDARVGERAARGRQHLLARRAAERAGMGEVAQQRGAIAALGALDDAQVLGRVVIAVGEHLDELLLELARERRRRLRRAPSQPVRRRPRLAAQQQRGRREAGRLGGDLGVAGRGGRVQRRKRVEAGAELREPEQEQDPGVGGHRALEQSQRDVRCALGQRATASGGEDPGGPRVGLRLGGEQVHGDHAVVRAVLGEQPGGAAVQRASARCRAGRRRRSHAPSGARSAPRRRRSGRRGRAPRAPRRRRPAQARRAPPRAARSSRRPARRSRGPRRARRARAAGSAR